MPADRTPSSAPDPMGEIPAAMEAQVADTQTGFQQKPPAGLASRAPATRPRTLHSVRGVMHTPEKRPRFSAQGKHGKHQDREQQLPQRLVFLNQFSGGRGKGPASARTARTARRRLGSSLSQHLASLLTPRISHFGARSAGRVFWARVWRRSLPRYGGRGVGTKARGIPGVFPHLSERVQLTAEPPGGRSAGRT